MNQQFAIFKSSGKLLNIFKIRWEKYEVIVEKSPSEEKYLESKKIVYMVFMFTVKLATVQMSRQTNKFP